MHARSLISTVCAATLGACSIGASPGDEARVRPENAESFAAHVVEDIEAHDWQNLLVASDPTHFQARVVEGGISEVEYLTALLGLDREGNRIQVGDTLEWSDLERIATVTLAPAGEQGPPFSYEGQAILTTGETLRLDTQITQVQGRFVLTGPGD